MQILVKCWTAMVVCYLIASRLRDRKDKMTWTGTLMNVLIYVMVFLMGMRMGANEDVIRSPPTIGLQSIFVTALVIVSGMLGVTLVRKILGIGRFGRNSSGGKVRASREEQKKNLRFTLIIAILTALGVACGYVLIVRILDLRDRFMMVTDEVTVILLVILLGSVGFTLGLDGTIFSHFKKAGPGIVLFPVAVLGGNILAGVIYGLISPVSIKDGIAVAAGFGWYTYVPTVISQSGNQVLSAISFLHNVIRETVGIIGIPLFASKIGYIESVAVPGIAAMDVCMPIVERSADEETMVYSFSIGCAMCLACPLIIPLCVG
ncbi:MAG: lysine exporter LysO family protein [Firmicutes bacterium]|nr:lysine exporter LysO family protein [Bacillota bacterium]